MSYHLYSGGWMSTEDRAEKTPDSAADLEASFGRDGGVHPEGAPLADIAPLILKLTSLEPAPLS